MLLASVEEGDESREEPVADDASSLTVGHGSTVQLLDIHVDTPSRGSIHRFRENQTTKTTTTIATPFQSMALASEGFKRNRSGVIRRAMPCMPVSWCASGRFTRPRCSISVRIASQVDCVSPRY